MVITSSSATASADALGLELPTLRRAAAHSSDGSTVALVFATADFHALVSNWACHAFDAGVHWFVIVAMDAELNKLLQRRPGLVKHSLLLPRVRSGDVSLTKLNVIGERQRFGRAVLEHGFNVVHSDADALWLRDPTPLFQGGDVVAERIWGKSRSVVSAWGAAICTGFYFLRSTPAVRELARTVQAEIAHKRTRQSSWQASDQFYVNVILHKHGVRWLSDEKMAGAADLSTRFHDPNITIGVATLPSGAIRLQMLPHRVVPRACPVLSPEEIRDVLVTREARKKRQSSEAKPRLLSGKARLWSGLLDSASVVHCFPPGGDPLPGEKRFIFMGHPRHTHAELAFARRQGLWHVDDGNEGSCI